MSTFIEQDVQDVLRGSDIINARQRDIKRVIMILAKALGQDRIKTQERTSWAGSFEVAVPLEGWPGEYLKIRRNDIGDVRAYAVNYLYSNIEGNKPYSEPGAEYVCSIWSALLQLIPILMDKSPCVREEIVFWQNVGRTE